VPPSASWTARTRCGLNRVACGARASTQPDPRLATAFRILFRVRANLHDRGARGAEVRSPDVDELLAFLRASRRGVAMGPGRRCGRADADDG